MNVLNKISLSRIGLALLFVVTFFLEGLLFHYGISALVLALAIGLDWLGKYIVKKRELCKKQKKFYQSLLGKTWTVLSFLLILTAKEDIFDLIRGNSNTLYAITTLCVCVILIKEFLMVDFEKKAAAKGIELFESKWDKYTAVIQQVAIFLFLFSAEFYGYFGGHLFWFGFVSLLVSTCGIMLINTFTVVKNKQVLQAYDLYQFIQSLFRKDEMPKKKEVGLKSMARRDDVLGTCMAILPFMGFLIFSLYPMLLSLLVSFHDLKSYDFTMMEWCGLENYKFVFTNRWIKRSVENTLYYCVSVPLNMAMSVFLANLFSKQFRGAKFGAVIAYIPSVCSIVGITMAFQWIFEANYGVVNTVLSAIGLNKINFMGDPRYYIPAVLVISIWLRGTNILQLQSAMANVSESLKDAAYLDGANGAQVFYHIVLPGISPTLFYVLITSLVAALQEMTIMQLISNNGVGPDFKAMTITYYIYRMGITNNVTEGFGRASALSWVFAIAVMILSKILFKISDKIVTYD